MYNCKIRVMNHQTPWMSKIYGVRPCSPKTCDPIDNQFKLFEPFALIVASVITKKIANQ
jgi:hypothetical protein